MKKYSKKDKAQMKKKDKQEFIYGIISLICWVWIFWSWYETALLHHWSTFNLFRLMSL